MNALTNSKSPLDLDLILKLVLEHVGKANISDLKNCRLVTHSWNKVAVQVLHERGYALELDYKKMVEFHSLLFRTQLSQRFSGKNNLVSVRLSLSLFPYKYLGGLSELGRCGQVLFLNPQLRLAFLKCRFIERQQEFQLDDEKKLVKSRINMELFNLFKLASNSLTSLTIFNDNRQAPTTFEEFDFRGYLSLEFPRLVDLRYKLLSLPAENKMLDLTKHVASVLLRAKNLIKLKLNLDVEEHEDMGNSKSTVNSLRALLKNCTFLNLQELRLQYGFSVELGEVLCEMKFPNLKRFKIKNELIILTKEYNQFLAENCPGLRHVDLKWGCICTTNNVIYEYPILPNILHLSLHPPFSTKTIYLESIHKFFSSVAFKFSSLRSIRMDFHVLLILGAHLKKSGHLIPPSYVYPVVSTVSTLEIIIEVDSPLIQMVDMELEEMTALMYYHTFPKLSNLIIKPCEDLVRVDMESGRLYQAIKIMINHRGVRSLEIHNYSNGWMEELLQDNPNLLGLENVELFELGPVTAEDPMSAITVSSLPGYLNLYLSTDQLNAYQK